MKDKRSREAIISADIQVVLERLGFKMCADEGRLMLMELMSKAGAGYYNSHTEESFLQSFGIMRKDRTPNRKGLIFLRTMLYNHSNYRSFCFELMERFRKPTTER